MPQRRLERDEVLGWQNPHRRNWPGIIGRQIVEGCPTCGRYVKQAKDMILATSRNRSGTRRQERQPAYRALRAKPTFLQIRAHAENSCGVAPLRFLVRNLAPPHGCKDTPDVRNACTILTYQPDLPKDSLTKPGDSIVYSPASTHSGMLAGCRQTVVKNSPRITESFPCRHKCAAKPAFPEGGPTGIEPATFGATIRRPLFLGVA